MAWLIRDAADELPVGGEDRWVVVIEADDHAAPDLEPGVLDRVDPLQQRPSLADVLELSGLPQRLLVGTLDAHEDRLDVRFGHALQEFLVLGQIHRRLGEEGERIPVGLLPGGHVPQEALDGRLVADEVVIHNEDDFHLLGPQSLQLAQGPAAAVFSRGRRPKVTMMSQNSHWNGHPREN